MPCCASAHIGLRALELLSFNDQLAPEHAEIADRFYNAGADMLINAVRDLPRRLPCRTALSATLQAH